jgi:hypothetical protein
MAKDLIIGAFKNYNFEQIKPWIVSINESGFKGDKVLFAINASPQTLKEIEEHGFRAISAPAKTDAMFHMERFFHIYDFLKKNVNQYRYVITTDVRDVIFQRDPIEYLLNNDSTPLIAVSESIKIKDEHWNRNNIIKAFGQYFYDDIQDEEVLNVGTLSGRADYVCDLCGFLFQMSLNRADWVADQAAYNVLMRWKPFKSSYKTVTLNDSYCCNLHITNKPNEKEMFAPFILEKPPVFEDGLLKTGETKEPFYIVHQYDRDLELLKFFNDKYKVEELITFRTT